MSGSRILWGQILAVGCTVLAGIWGATQWVAAALGYQPELGEPIGIIHAVPVYPPLAFFWWWFSFDAYAPAIFDTGGIIAASGALVAVIVAVAMSLWRARDLMPSIGLRSMSPLLTAQRNNLRNTAKTLRLFAICVWGIRSNTATISDRLILGSGRFPSTGVTCSLKDRATWSFQPTLTTDRSNRSA